MSAFDLTCVFFKAVTTSRVALIFMIISFRYPIAVGVLIAVCLFQLQIPKQVLGDSGFVWCVKYYQHLRVRW